MRVDFHAHYLPAPYLAALCEGGGPALAKPSDDDTLSAHIAGLDAARIDLQVLSTGPNAPYLADKAQAVGAARIGNDALADAVARYGDRFAAFGCLPLPYGAAAAREAVRCLDELGFLGVNVGCSALGQPIDSPAFEDLWAELDRREAVVFVHPGGVVAGTEPGLAGMDDSIIAVTIGSAAEIATAALRLASLSRRFRKVRPIIGLLGGSLPFLLQRCMSIVGKWPFPSTLSQFASAEEVIAELRRFHYEINLLPDPSVLESARRAYGIDRLVFGSDAPTGSPATALSFLAAGGISEAEQNAILEANAAALLTRPQLSE